MILNNAIGVRSDSGPVAFLIVLGFRDCVVQLQNLNAKSFDSNDLIRVDIELLLVVVLVGAWLCQVEAFHGIIIIFGYDGACPSSR